ncbi:MAG: ANTAR domain-containing protein [Pirellulaceae bacterium]
MNTDRAMLEGVPEVVLISGDSYDGNRELLRDEVAKFQRNGSAVALLVPPTVGSFVEACCELGADAIVPRLDDPAWLACILFGAAANRKRLREKDIEIEKLVQRKEEKKLIDLAARVVARRKNIFETEAQAQIRDESRSRREKMVDVARRILDAEKFFDRPVDGEGEEE